MEDVDIAEEPQEPNDLYNHISNVVSGILLGAMATLVTNVIVDIAYPLASGYVQRWKNNYSEASAVKEREKEMEEDVTLWNGQSMLRK